MHLTHDGEATMDDQAVLEFCKHGFIVLPAAAPDAVNARATDWLDEWGMRGVGETELLRQEWFIEGVLKARALTGVLRALLGPNYGLPTVEGNVIPDDGAPRHYQLPDGARPRAQNCPFSPAMNWHHDHDSPFGSETHYLYVFYYPQAISQEHGPT